LISRRVEDISALNHPHICTIYDIDEHDGRRFIAMEYLEGRSLKQRLAEKPLSVDEILALAAEVADGLEAAHAKGILHRDIKPASTASAPSRGSRRSSRSSGSGPERVLFRRYGMIRTGVQRSVVVPSPSW
jgi:serine/threonine protein kinase